MKVVKGLGMRGASLKVTVVSSNYPTSHRPNYGAFVYNLTQKLALENEVTVISPLKIHDFFKFKEGGYGSEICKVQRPITISLSNKKISFLDSGKASNFFFKKSVERSLSKLYEKPDVVYCHFFINALAALDYCERHKVPLVVASGESTYDFFDSLPKNKQEKLKDKVDKVICVSQSNLDLLVQRGFSNEKLTLIPNAVNYDVFRPLNKKKCKLRLGFNDNDFIVGFIGHFIERKGPNRVVKAIKVLNKKEIKLVCVGDGGKLEKNDFTTIIPPVPNENLPEIINAFDIFVLPTLHEGHCNVIEEAMACCVPVISSIGTSVEIQLKNGKGVLVDPMNIDALSEGIRELMCNDEKYSNIVDLLRRSRGRDSLNKRAKIIGDLLTEVVNKYG